MNSRRSIQLGALAAALALALPGVQAATTPTAPLVAKVNLGNIDANASYDRFIVTYRSGSTEHASHAAAVQNISAALASAGLNRSLKLGATQSPMTVSYKRRLATGADLVTTSHKLSATDAATLMRQIATDPAVAHVQVDAMMHVVRDFAAPATMKPADLITGAPNDPYYAKYQWHFNNAVGGADVEKAWAKSDGAGVVVAVIDTGITQHSDLDESLADAGYDFINDHFVSGRATDGRVSGGWDLGDWTTGSDYASCVDSSHPAEASSWHGTHVSGTIAELTNNGVGMAGVAHAARVLPIRALGHCGGYTSDIADAIEWASGGHVDGVPDNQNPAQVISMSLGGGGQCTADDVTGKAIADAISRGVTVVVAAGNSGADASNFSPASCPGVITVASNGITGKRAFYSNYGTTVTISAPGGGIYQNDASSGQQANPEGFVWSTINSGTTTPSTETYGGMAGTSQATPHVAGTVALILGAEKAAGDPLSTPAQIKDILTSSARPFPVTEDQPIGAGIVDAAAAVDKALGDNGGGGDNPPPTDSATPLTNGGVLAGQSGAAGGSTVYALDVPAGARYLNLRTFGGTGDVTVYVKAGSAPAADGSDADFTSARPGNTETVTIATPKATTYYIRVVGVQAYANLSVLGLYR
jgi:serine protease